MGISLYSDVVRILVIGSPSTVVAVNSSALICFRICFCSFLHGASIRPNFGLPNSSTDSPAIFSADFPITAMISIPSKAIIMPSLSVVHTLPSFFKKDAPALSSPPMPIVPSNKSCEKYLKPTGTSNTGISALAAHLSIIVVHTTVLPTPLSFHPRVVNK